MSHVRLSRATISFGAILASVLILLFNLPAHAQFNIPSDESESDQENQGMDESAEEDLEDMAEEEMPEEPEGPSEVDLSQSLLFDMNGDGIVTVDAFGDSITRGVGDFAGAGEFVESVFDPVGEAGYPLRTELFLNIPIGNLGDPGERLTTQGMFRFAAQIPSRRPDIVVLSGGSNDGFERIDGGDFERAVQTMINIAKASGVQPVIMTSPGTLL